jgi:4-oxalomesaconate tautomerase
MPFPHHRHGIGAKGPAFRSEHGRRCEREGRMQQGVRCMLMRGGTSKGIYVLAEELPADAAARDRVLLELMGSPDARQVDGLGGAHPLTSKAAIVSRSPDPGWDVDFLFCQVGIDKPAVDTTPNCGNILAGVAPFAIERGLVAARHPETRVRVRTINTGSLAELLVQTPNGRVVYGGEARIDGVPGTAAPIAIDFLDAAGSVCGSLLPTGRAVDQVAGAAVTLIDNGMPVIVLAASPVGRTGYEPREALDRDAGLKARLEEIRRAAGPLMNLGEVADRVAPKVVLVAPRAATWRLLAPRLGVRYSRIAPTGWVPSGVAAIEATYGCASISWAWRLSSASPSTAASPRRRLT